MTKPSNPIRPAMDRALSALTGVPQLEERVLRSSADAAVNASVCRPMRLARLVLIPVLLLMLATGAFAAGRLGLLERLLAHNGGALAPEAAQLIAEPTVVYATNTHHASLHVQEALRSDSDVLLLIDVTPRAEGLLLVPDTLLADASHPDSLLRSRLGFPRDAEDALLTHAQARSKQLVALSMHLNTPERNDPANLYASALPYTLLDCVLRDDGGLTMLLHLRDEVFADASADATLQLRFSTIPVERHLSALPEYALPSSFRFVTAQRSAAFATLRLSAAQTPANLPPLTASDGALPLLMEDVGLRIDSVSLVRTPLHTRWEINCTRLPGAPDDLCLYLCDADGQQLISSFGSRSDCVSGESSLCTGFICALPDAPQTIRIAVRTILSAEPLAVAEVPVKVAEP